MVAEEVGSNSDDNSDDDQALGEGVQALADSL